MINVNSTDVLDQVQLNLSGIETPYVWVSNTSSTEVAQISTEDGRVLRTINLGSDPSRTAVDVDFNCWVAYRSGSAVARLDSNWEAPSDALFDNGFYSSIGLDNTWNYLRAVAINADGNVWVGSWSHTDMKLVDPESGDIQNTYVTPIRPWNSGDPQSEASRPIVGGASAYGFSMDAFGNLWASQRDFWAGQYDAITGEHIKTYSFPFTVNFYGIGVDLDGNVWLGNGWAYPAGLVYLPRSEVLRCEAEGGTECYASGAIRIDPPTSLDSDGDCRGSRGVAVDQSGNVWVNCNDEDTIMHVDGETLSVLGVYEVGDGPLGITATADGSIWTVNAGGGAPARPAGETEGWESFLGVYSCPNGHSSSSGGSVTVMRGSDGKVTATYPTCGDSPYTYSDMAGYNLRSVALRSGWWRQTHDSGIDNLDWERMDWNTSFPTGTEMTFAISASNNPDDLNGDLNDEIIIDQEGGQICVLNGDTLVETCGTDDEPTRSGVDIESLGISGRYFGIEAFFFTRNDYLGPVIEDLTISSQCIPTDELCNGIDDNCDGYVDNAVPDGFIEPISPWGACSTGLPGMCNVGHFVCAAGAGICVRALEPDIEICDGADNDCDGVVDEGVTNACGDCGDLPVETCNETDDNCNGLVDEGVQLTCLSYTDCTTYLTCEECPEAPLEFCDGLDNNCNGLIDEGSARVCTDYSEDNLCGTILICDEFCPEPPGELCNGIDDNCNGLIDDDAFNTCINFADCTTFQTCDTCEPSPEELCDGLDNDCDSEIDEGALNACGTCGEPPEEECDGIDNNCNGETDEGVTNICGFCGEVPYEICDGLDNNCNGEIDEGVSNRCGACGPEPDEVCNGLDDDCDGTIDDGVANSCGLCGPTPSEECDGLDNNCDGEIDEDTDALCDAEISGAICVPGAGECGVECFANECPDGHICWEDYCIEDPCLSVACSSGYICIEGECFDLCALNDVICEDDLVCVGGLCMEDVCNNTGCDDGFLCVDNACIEDPCFGLSCDIGEICLDGECLDDPCNEVFCEDGMRCDDGICIDACTDVICNSSEVCVDGVCITDNCSGISCPPGAICINGNCFEEACIGIVCESGQVCQDGGCETTRVGGPCGEGLSYCGDGLVCIDGICRDENDPLLLDMGVDISTYSAPSSGLEALNTSEGCTCAVTHTQNKGESLPFFLLITLITLFRSRRTDFRSTSP
jgi:streptogramin lyase